MEKKTFHILSAWEAVQGYIDEAAFAKVENLEILWSKHLIEPYWTKVMQWAPPGVDGRKPKAIKDLEVLKQQLEAFKGSSIVDELEERLVDIYKKLPKNDEDVITIALYPLDVQNTVVAEKQNGVLGSCEFGNMVISINPLAKDWDKWISYVIAHEYHHSVWGHNYFVLKGKRECSLLTYLLNEGQADAFAKSLHKELKPSWINPLSEEKEREVWEQMQPHLNSLDPKVQSLFMFGSEEKGIPWCAGYLTGYRIVQKYMERHPYKSYLDLIDMDAEELLEHSGYFEK